MKRFVVLFCAGFWVLAAGTAMFNVWVIWLGFFMMAYSMIQFSMIIRLDEEVFGDELTYQAKLIGVERRFLGFELDCFLRRRMVKKVTNHGNAAR